jgi:hypothetical protein
MIESMKTTMKFLEYLWNISGLKAKYPPETTCNIILEYPLLGFLGKEKAECLINCLYKFIRNSSINWTYWICEGKYPSDVLQYCSREELQYLHEIATYLDLKPQICGRIYRFMHLEEGKQYNFKKSERDYTARGDKLRSILFEKQDEFIRKIAHEDNLENIIKIWAHNNVEAYTLMKTEVEAEEKRLKESEESAGSEEPEDWSKVPLVSSKHATEVFFSKIKSEYTCSKAKRSLSRNQGMTLAYGTFIKITQLSSFREHLNRVLIENEYSLSSAQLKELIEYIENGKKPHLYSWYNEDDEDDEDDDMNSKNDKKITGAYEIYREIDYDIKHDYCDRFNKSSDTLYM